MLKQRSYFIYVLRNPHNGQIFYVGKAQVGKETQTLSRHLCGRSNPWKRNVIEAILRNGGQPKLIVLRTSLTEQVAFRLERNLIRVLRSLGFHLTNLTDGGEGTSGYKHTFAVCNARSERMKAQNPMKNASVAQKIAAKRSKLVLQFRDGELVGKYSSAIEAQRQTGVFQQNITACCRFETEKASGYVWRYSDAA